VHWPWQVLPPVRTAVPLVISVWDLAPLAYREPRWNAVSVIGKYRIILRLALRNASHIITHSRSTADEVIRRFGVPRRKVSTTYPGLDPLFEKEAMTPSRPDSGGPILYIGTNTPRKNLRLLLRAFAILVRQGVKNDLALRVNFGNGGEEAFAKAAAEMRVPRHRIELMPSVGRGELVNTYRSAAVLAFPSLYEGFGLPLLEAMACGLPVVALNRSAMPEVIGDAGVLVGENSPGAFAEGIVEAIRLSSENGKETAARAKARAARFRWGTAVSKTLSVYEQVTGQLRG